MNIALLGFGTVGSHFYKLCEGRTDLHVAAVLSRRPRPELTCTVTADYDEIVRDPSIDIVVEVMGGIEPAYSYLCAAMRAGKHVVTANKQLMCAHFEELTSLAKEKGVALRCTAAAGGGIPWLTSLSRASELDEIKAVEGILNGTTNYMLSAMTNSGADYAPALRKAQELGYAEADPTADVEGLDARRKIVLSADLAFGVNIREEDIPCVGISSVTAADIAGAEEDAKVCCLGGGPVVSFMDRSTIYDKELYRMAFSLAEKNGISCQTKSRIAGGNDSGAIHVSRGGVRTLAISLPCRYLHSPSCLADLNDLDACTALLPLLVKSIMEEVSTI